MALTDLKNLRSKFNAIALDGTVGLGDGNLTVEVKVPRDPLSARPTATPIIVGILSDDRTASAGRRQSAGGPGARLTGDTRLVFSTNHLQFSSAKLRLEACGGAAVLELEALLPALRGDYRVATTVDLLAAGSAVCRVGLEIRWAARDAGPSGSTAPEAATPGGPGMGSQAGAPDLNSFLAEAFRRADGQDPGASASSGARHGGAAGLSRPVPSLPSPDSPEQMLKHFQGQGLEITCRSGAGGAKAVRKLYEREAGLVAALEESERQRAQEAQRAREAPAGQASREDLEGQVAHLREQQTKLAEGQSRWRDSVRAAVERRLT